MRIVSSSTSASEILMSPPTNRPLSRMRSSTSTRPVDRRATKFNLVRHGQRVTRRSTRSRPRGPEQPRDLGEQVRRRARLGEKAVAARALGPLPFGLQRVRGQRHDGDVLGLCVALQLGRDFPAVDARQRHVEQDQVGQARVRQLQRFFAGAASIGS